MGSSHTGLEPLQDAKHIAHFGQINNGIGRGAKVVALAPVAKLTLAMSRPGNFCVIGNI